MATVDVTLPNQPVTALAGNPQSPVQSQQGQQVSAADQAAFLGRNTPFSALNTKLQGGKPLSLTETNIINRELKNPTVITGATGAKVVNQTKNALNNMSPQQPVVNPTVGTDPTKAQGDGTATGLAPEVTAANAALDSEYAGITKQLQDIQSSLPTQEQLAIKAIQDLYAKRKDEMNIYNQSVEGGAKINEARSGRARYATEVSQGIITDVEAKGMERIAEINRQEQDAINQAKAAFQQKNLDVAMQLFNQAKDLRQEKTAAIKDQRDYAMQVDKFNMEKKKYDVEGQKETREGAQKEIFDEFKNLGSKAFVGFTPEMIQDLEAKAGKPMGYIKDYQKAMADIEEIEAAGLVSKSMTDDQKEYNLAKQDGYKGSFLDYMKTVKNLGENAPASYKEWSLAGGESGTGKTYAQYIAKEKGIDSKTTTQVDSLVRSFENNQIVKDFVNVQNKKIGVDRVMESGVSGPADLDLVFEFMKALDPNSVVREQEYANAAKSGNIFKGIYAKFNGYLKEDGGFLPENVRSQFQELITQKYENQAMQYDNLFKEKARQIDRKTGESDGGDYLTQFKFDLPNSKEDKAADSELQSFGVENGMEDLIQMYKDNDYSPREILDILKKKPEGVADLTSFSTGEGTFKHGDVAYAGYRPEEITKALDIDPETFRAQCGRLINGATGIGVGDSYESKMKKTDPNITEPAPGLVFVMPTKEKWGHTGIVAGISDDGKYILAYDSNWNTKSAPERVGAHKIPISQITGYAMPKEGSKLYKFGTDQLIAKKEKPRYA